MSWTAPFTAKKVKKRKLKEKRISPQIPSEPDIINIEPVPKPSDFSIGCTIMHNTYGIGILDAFALNDTVKCIFSKSLRVVPLDSITKVEEPNG